MDKGVDQIKILFYGPSSSKSNILQAIKNNSSVGLDIVIAEKEFDQKVSKNKYNNILIHENKYKEDYSEILKRVFVNNRDTQLVLVIEKTDDSLIKTAYSDGFNDYISLDAGGSNVELQFFRLLKLSKQRVRLEKKLKEGEDLFRLIAEHSSDLFCLHEPNGTIIYASPSSEQILGYSPAEMIGKKPLDFIESSYLKDVDKQTFISLLESRNSRIRYKFQHKNGSIRWLEATSNDIFDSSGQITRIQSFSRDITESVHLFDDLMKALSKEKELADLKSRFVSIASHEFRTPLSTISASAELLQYKLEATLKDSKGKGLIKAVDAIIEEVDRMNGLINDILVLGRLEAGKTPFNPVFTDVEALLKQIINAEFTTRYPKRKVGLKIYGNNKKVEVDPSLFRHIFVNLLSNAYKYSSDNQIPKVSLRFDKNGLQIEVVDDGVGVPKEDQKNIFSSFFRARNVLNIEGTGMGLVIVKEFVELHKGAVVFESEEGKGAKFVVSIPYEQ